MHFEDIISKLQEKVSILENSTQKIFIHHKIRNLRDTYMKLKPRKKRAIEIAGSVVKWIYGSPDAEDLRMLQKNNTNIISKINEIIDYENSQFEINTLINDKIINLTKNINNELTSFVQIGL